MAYRLLGFRPGLLLLAAFAVAGCYTGPVNMRPTVEIKPPTGTYFRGQTAEYTATASDPDGDPVTLAWATSAGDCPGNSKSPDSCPSSWSPDTMLSVGSPLTNAHYCVWVKATDSNGAVDVDTWTGMPANHVPVPRIDVVLPAMAPDPNAPDTFPVHTMFMLSGARTTDEDAGDPRIFAASMDDCPDCGWSIVEPAKTDVVAGPCPDQPDPALTCFTVDVPDDYVVQLKFSDGVDPVVVAKTLHVRPAQPPVATIKVVSPVASTAVPQTGSVQSYPLGTSFEISAKDSTGGAAALKFTWDHDFTGAPGTGANFDRCTDDQSDFLRCFTADAPGDYTVTVTVSDGENVSVPVSITVHVLPDAMPCLDVTSASFPPNPYPARADEVTTLTLDRVIDDLDPFPNEASFQNTAKFDWFVDGRLTSIGDLNYTKLDANTYSLGDAVKVRVQIRDRDTKRSEAAFFRCGDADTCSADSNGCFQRWTWTVKFVL